MPHTQSHPSAHKLAQTHSVARAVMVLIASLVVLTATVVGFVQASRASAAPAPGSAPGTASSAASRQAPAPDSDGDGISDAAEQADHTNPRDPLSPGRPVLDSTQQRIGPRIDTDLNRPVEHAPGAGWQVRGSKVGTGTGLIDEVVFYPTVNDAERNNRLFLFSLDVSDSLDFTTPRWLYLTASFEWRDAANRPRITRFLTRLQVVGGRVDVRDSSWLIQRDGRPFDCRLSYAPGNPVHNGGRYSGLTTAAYPAGCVGSPTIVSATLGLYTAKNPKALTRDVEPSLLDLTVPANTSRYTTASLARYFGNGSTPSESTRTWRGTEDVIFDVRSATDRLLLSETFSSDPTSSMTPLKDTWIFAPTGCVICGPEGARFTTYLSGSSNPTVTLETPTEVDGQTMWTLNETACDEGTGYFAFYDRANKLLTIQVSGACLRELKLRSFYAAAAGADTGADAGLVPTTVSGRIDATRVPGAV